MRAPGSVVAPLHVRTPLVRSVALSTPERAVYFKLDCLQPPGSFKLRGIGRVVQSCAARGVPGVVSSSSGNAGIATAYAAQQVGLACVVVVPRTTPASIRRLLEEAYGATAVEHGAVWDEANAEATRIAEARGWALVHPFADPVAWAGHATLVEECVEQLAAFDPQGRPTLPDCVVASVGGGGLLQGIITGVVEQRQRLLEEAQTTDVHVPPRTKVVAVETTGANSFAHSLQSGEASPLPGGQITSIAKSLGAVTPLAAAVDAARSPPPDAGYAVDSRIVTDAQAVAACLRIANERRVLVEPSCGAALVPAYAPDLLPGVFDGCRTVVIQVCGGAVVDLPKLLQWAKDLGVDPLASRGE